MLFGGDGTYCFVKERVVITKLKNHLLFEEISPPTTFSYNRIFAINSNHHSICGIIVSNSHWLIQLTKNSFQSQSTHFQSTVKQHNFFQSQTMVLSGFSTFVQTLLF